MILNWRLTRVRQGGGCLQAFAKISEIVSSEYHTTSWPLDENSLKGNFSMMVLCALLPFELKSPILQLDRTKA